MHYHIVLSLDKWREYPVFVTAYSYFFGAVFMGLCSLQNVVSEEKRENFSIPKPVRLKTLLLPHFTLSPIPTSSLYMFLCMLLLLLLLYAIF